MALHGLIDVDAYARDPTLRSRVMVVPFGLPGDPPPARRRARCAPRSRDRRRTTACSCGAAACGAGWTR